MPLKIKPYFDYELKRQVPFFRPIWSPFILKTEMVKRVWIHIHSVEKKCAWHVGFCYCKFHWENVKQGRIASESKFKARILHIQTGPRSTNENVGMLIRWISNLNEREGSIQSNWTTMVRVKHTFFFRIWISNFLF